jgi:hypothetical protein
MTEIEFRMVKLLGNAFHAAVVPAGGTEEDRIARITPRHRDSLTTGDYEAALDHILDLDLEPGGNSREAHRTT